MKNYIKYYLFLILPTIIIVIYLLGSSKKFKLEHEIGNELINGIIIDKYIDQYNHGYETIVYLQNNRRKKFTIPKFDKGLFFDKVNIGDTIFKPHNNYEFIVRSKAGQKFQYLFK